MSAKKPVTQAAPNGNGHTVESKRFTINVQSTGNVSVTIRTDDKEEALQLLEEFKLVVNPPRQRKPRLNVGDPCGAEECAGYMTLQTAVNKKTGAKFDFLGCSLYPNCSFTAYVAQEAETEGS